MAVVRKPRRLPAPGFGSFVVLVVLGAVLFARGTSLALVTAGVLLMAAGTCCLRPTGSQP